ncbi:MAG: cytosolic protein [Flavobacteriaceae bacterium]|nr:MAG: cytosolic protein [Flavobacteriaceae bacterium]
MGIFNNLFKSNTEVEKDKKINWLPLTESSPLEAIISASKTKPMLIFKHSTRCGISRMVLKSFERNYNLEDTAIDLYFLDLLNFRALSNQISKKLNVYHQSPQILVIKNEQVIYHDSHYSISIDAIKEVLENN